MRRFVVFATMILICSVHALATDFSSLPLEAQASISAAMRRNLAARYPSAIQDFTLTASDAGGAGFGYQVAIDGNTVVVGAQFATTNGNLDQGAVYVFVKPTNGWANMTQTAELTASDGQSYDGLGCSVGISGNTVVAGACNATVNGNPDEGAVYVFVEPATGWTNMTETAKLTASDGASYSYFGSAAAISDNTIVVGSPNESIENEAPGIAYVFVEPESGWTSMTQTAELTPSNGANLDHFGVAVSISSKTLVVTGGFCDSCAQTAYAFVEPDGGWMNTTETAQLTASDGNEGNSFGASVAIDGQTVVVGDSTHGFEKGGAVYVFVEPSGGWRTTTQTAILDVSDNELGCLGTSVSLSGNVVVTGDDCANGKTGAAYVFVRPNGGWQNTSHFAVRLLVSFKHNQDYFGASVGISGTTGVVGAPYAGNSDPGEAFVFTKN